MSRPNRKPIDRRTVGIQPPQNILLNPITGQLTISASGRHCDKIVDQWAALADQDIAVVGVDLMGLLEPLPELGRQLAQRRANLLHLSLRHRDRHQ